MPKNTRCKPAKCERHQFWLKPRGEYSLLAHNLKVSFCQPAHPKDPTELALTHNCLDCPSFNHDINFATPAFILSSQKAESSFGEGEQLERDHNLRMVNYSEEKSSMNVPKPRSKSQICHVCRVKFQDYLEHIESPFHKNKIKASPFNDYILDLASKFTPSAGKAQPQNDNSTTAQTHPANLQQEQFEIISKPQKKVKLSTEEANQPTANPIPRVRVQTAKAKLPNPQPSPKPTSLPVPAPRVLPLSNFSRIQQPCLNPMEQPPFCNFSQNINLFLNNFPGYFQPPLMSYLQYQRKVRDRLNQATGPQLNLGAGELREYHSKEKGEIDYIVLDS